jgi:hypothetical protein
MTSCMVVPVVIERESDLEYSYLISCAWLCEFHYVLVSIVQFGPSRFVLAKEQ